MGSESQIIIDCPKCMTRQTVSLSLAGKSVICPGCKAEIHIPAKGYQIFRPTTIWQRAAAAKLGIEILPDMSGEELAELIKRVEEMGNSEQ